MSETEIHYGEVTEIPVPHKCETLLQQIEYIEQKYDCVFEDKDMDYPYSEEFIKAGDRWYKIADNQLDSNSCTITETEGKLKYGLSFYNGGCSFQEALEDALERYDLVHHLKWCSNSKG